MFKISVFTSAFVDQEDVSFCPFVWPNMKSKVDEVALSSFVQVCQHSQQLCQALLMNPSSWPCRLIVWQQVCVLVQQEGTCTSGASVAMREAKLAMSQVWSFWKALWMVWWRMNKKASTKTIGWRKLALSGQFLRNDPPGGSFVAFKLRQFATCRDAEFHICCLSNFFQICGKFTCGAEMSEIAQIVQIMVLWQNPTCALQGLLIQVSQNLTFAEFMCAISVVCIVPRSANICRLCSVQLSKSVVFAICAVTRSLNIWRLHSAGLTSGERRLFCSETLCFVQKHNVLSRNTRCCLEKRCFV